MKRDCLECGRPFDAVLETAKYCGTTCRARRSKKRAAAVQPVTMSSIVDPTGKPLLFDAALQEFERLGVSGSVAALQALSAARLLDAAGTADSSRSGLSREFSRLRAEALRDVPPPGDPVDEIRARVAAKRRLSEAEARAPRAADHPLAQYLN